MLLDPGRARSGRQSLIAVVLVAIVTMMPGRAGMSAEPSLNAAPLTSAGSSPGPTFDARCEASSGQGASPAPVPTLGPSAPPEAAGSVVGTYVQQEADGERRTTVFGVTVGLYTDAFRPGTDLLEPPQPLAVTITGFDGSWGFCNLPAGSYFVTTIGEPVYTPGAIVELGPGQTVFVDLVGCVDCPAPA